MSGIALDAGTPPIPQWVFGISWTITSTARSGIPRSTNTLVIPEMICSTARCETPSHILTSTVGMRYHFGPRGLNSSDSECRQPVSQE